MTRCARLWAIGFDDPERAGRFRDQIAWLGRDKHCLNLLDVAVAVRYPDGCLTLNGEAFPIVTNLLGSTPASFLAGLALWVPPMTGPAVEAVLGEFGACAVAAGISDDFVREVAGLIKPGTSVLFVLDDGGDIDAILPAIRGWGGTVLIAMRMIAFRKSHPTLGRRRYWRDDVHWYGVGPDVDLSFDSHSVAYSLHGGSRGDRDLYVMINAYHEPLEFEIQESPAEGWHRAIDTGLESPLDISDPGEEPPVASLRYRVLPRSVVVLLGGEERA